jgi:hypothetical protein
MIRRRLPEGELLIPQHEHALHAGRLAALRADLPEPRAALIRAVSLHDAGWPLLDDAPEPLEDGHAPHVFEHPPGYSLPAWRRSVAIARASGALEALLVSGHFAAHSRAFREEFEPLQAVWRLGVATETESAGLGLIAWCDAISLCLLCDPGTRIGLPAGVSFRDGRLAPWPFPVDEIRDSVVGRLLPGRWWESTQEFRTAYRNAPLHGLDLRLQRAD